jgi:hypothetical protein
MTRRRKRRRRKRERKRRDSQGRAGSSLDGFYYVSVGAGEQGESATGRSQAGL